MMRKTILAACLLFMAAFPCVSEDFYWEAPESVGTRDSRFPSSSTNGTVSAVIWQDIDSSAASPSIWLSGRVYDGSAWIERNRFAGPFPYAGEVPSISSVTVTPKGRIIVPVASGVDSVTVLVSDDLGASFTSSLMDGGRTAPLAPRVFVRADGGYLLFAASGTEDNFTLIYSRSDDGLAWQAMQSFEPSLAKRRAFLPTHAALDGRDIVVFQAFHDATGRSSYQLYSSVSRDKGRSWSEPRLITDFADPLSAGSGETFTGYHNQRAKMASIGNSVSVVWERARTTSERYSIYHMSLDSSGAASSRAERVSSQDGYCYDPNIISFRGSPAVVWFDNRRGVNRVYLAQRLGLLWSETDLSKSSVDSVFARLVVTAESIETYWQQNLGRGQYRIVRLAPDHTAPTPGISAVGIASGQRSRAELVRFALSIPEDSSGTAGYSVAWGRGARPEVPTTIMSLPSETRLTKEADEDGSWYLGVRVADYAGNWSEPAYFEYVRDTTPPAAPIVFPGERDEKGFLASNTFELSWDDSGDDDVAGYAWSLQYLGSLAQARAFVNESGQIDAEAASRAFKIAPPEAVMRTSTPSARFQNQDNGLYALSVSSIDSVGNVGPSAVRFIALDKYVPVTYVTAVTSEADRSGSLSVSIVGRGFSEGGAVGKIYVDRDGSAPWDREYDLSSGAYRVVNDRLISGLVLSDLEEGDYRVTLIHPTRGPYQARARVSVTESGTIKLGDYRYEFVPPWERSREASRVPVDPGKLFMYSLFAFALLALAVSFRGVASAARDTVLVRGEVRALLTGDIMPSERKRRSASLRKRGVGLRFKLAFFTTTLVISVVLIVSIPLGLRFSSNQERTLARGLESRVNVLLESLASGARAYLPSQNLLELGFLPAQIGALEEAKYATITGPGVANSATGISFVWGSNDPAIADKIDTQTLEPGRSNLVSPENQEIDSRVALLNDEAERAVGELSSGIASLTQEGLRLALSVDQESVRRRDEIQVISRQLEERLSSELSRLSVKGIGSWPAYDADALDRSQTSYVFFKPVLYRVGNSPRFVHGTVRVEISTESLLKAVDADRRQIVKTTAYIALFAVLMGVLGALALASIIISPIRKLAGHVAMIRDTEDKEDLHGKEISLKSRDEIGILGETINDMTRGLVKAAAASKDLTVGKEVQKMFIPLETDDSGRKLTSGRSGDDRAEFFGYYEGAKGVSGDYFDYIKLDDRHYAVIKCDVAGKGVPAALIMVEVATLFLDYFKDWKYEKHGYKLGYIVSRINDLIESRGFKGRFAAFTLCIFDTVSGSVHFCNAGDNLVHMYSASERRMKTISLRETSAAGVFPSFMIDMKGGFTVETLKLSAGDVLFLYTDGIEEAKRMFRSADMQVFACAEEGLAPEAPHGNHSVGQDNEELGPDRVNSIIEAVFSRKSYTLSKWHNPEGNVDYEFDFASCEGSLEEAIIALVAVEKVFRMYVDPSAGELDRVQVDKKVDSFLARHFLQYERYCSDKKDHPEHGEYLYYTGVREDAQYDDLTILALRKKGGN